MRNCPDITILNSCFWSPSTCLFVFLSFCLFASFWSNVWRVSNLKSHSFCPNSKVVLADDQGQVCWAAQKDIKLFNLSAPALKSLRSLPGVICFFWHGVTKTGPPIIIGPSAKRCQFYVSDGSLLVVWKDLPPAQGFAKPALHLRACNWNPLWGGWTQFGSCWLARFVLIIPKVNVGRVGKMLAK